MHFQSLLPVAALFATVAYASPVPEMESMDVEDVLEKRQNTPDVPCTGGAVIFGVRGSSGNPTANSDPSIYNALPKAYYTIADAVKNHFGGDATLQAVAYPASDPNAANNANYGPSVEAGVTSLQNAIYSYVDRCDTGVIIVLGYSQGAQVVTQALAGDSSHGKLRAKGRVRAVALFADPHYVDGHSFDAGSGANNGRNGLIPDYNAYDFLQTNFPNRLRSYCQAGDAVCDNGGDGGIHQRSPAHFEQAAQNFILGAI